MDTYLPLLRRDLALHPGPSQPDGEKSWTLHDPVSNRFFRIGWPEFEALQRFPLVQSIQELCTLIRKETVLKVDEEDISALNQFLLQNDLVIQPGQASSARFSEIKNKRQKSFFSQILHGYLFFTVPLIRPQRVLKRLLPFFSPLFTAGFFFSMMAILMIGLMLTAQRWDEFFASSIASFSLEGLLAGGLAFIGIKLIHEFSHALMATKFGVRVASMGVSFMVLYPVLYTETSGAWKIVDKKRRLLIGAAGMLAELCLAALALMVWHIVPEGGIKSAAFFVSVISLAGTLLVNLNPLMRFDGYFLLSDALGMDNLQARGFALARWNLRRILFGWKDEPPETLPRSMHRTVLIYSYATWIYRFFLFLGIALLVYHLFFQPLGLFLMVVELAWFIALPIWSEVREWVKSPEKMNWNPKSKRTRLLLGALVLFLLIPWRGTIDVPAMLTPAQYATLYPPVPAMIEEILVKDGEYVKTGETLVILKSPALEHSLKLAQASLTKLEIQYRNERTSAALIARTIILETQVREAKSRLEGLERQAEQLRVTARFDGQVRDIAQNLHKGRWVGTSMPLVSVVNHDQIVLQGYIREADINRIEPQTHGVFYSDTGMITPFNVDLQSVQSTNAASLEWPALAGIHGGSIDTRPPSSASPQTLIPQENIYVAHLTPHNPKTQQKLSQKIVGHVKLEGRRESSLIKLLKQSAALVVQESDF